MAQMFKWHKIQHEAVDLNEADKNMRTDKTIDWN